jgi:hypothetical protein
LAVGNAARFNVRVKVRAGEPVVSTCASVLPCISIDKHSKADDEIHPLIAQAGANSMARVEAHRNGSIRISNAFVERA